MTDFLDIVGSDLHNYRIVAGSRLKWGLLKWSLQGTDAGKSFGKMIKL